MAFGNPLYSFQGLGRLTLDGEFDWNGPPEVDQQTRQALIHIQSGIPKLLDPARAHRRVGGDPVLSIARGWPRRRPRLQGQRSRTASRGGRCRQ
jgi:hypothetical protein